MANKIKPALIGGAAVGILSVLPVVSALNLVCCAWAVGGGLLAAYLYVKDAPAQVPPGEGAMVGGLAGLLGAIIYLVIYVPLILLTNLGKQYSEILRSAGLKDINGNMIFIVSSLFVALMLGVMAAVGGTLGIKLFEKRAATPVEPPLPPPDFSNMP